MNRSFFFSRRIKIDTTECKTDSSDRDSVKESPLEDAKSFQVAARERGDLPGPGSWKRRQDSEEASLTQIMQKKLKKPHVRSSSSFPVARTSLARTIIAEGYIRVVMTIDRLDELRLAIYGEIEGNEVKPYPRFGEVQLTKGTIFVK